jgi:diaminohydroxyphosphoribosylaminopyrimidine deaminase/5-amino-6-(5-phosphoribosylamino)uracil reductase
MNNDILFMQRCLDLAIKGIGKTYPNPLVGCVIVLNNKIISEGWHNSYGGIHAEVDAINKIKDKSILKKSSLYVNLEPCNHHGKTPPCTDLILKHGIQNIVIGIKDPNKNIDGNGVEYLKKNGCNVKTNVLEEECNFINRRFISFNKFKRPYIILKWAESKDGFIGPIKDKMNSGKVLWLTNEKSRVLSHKWRTQEQSILVGVQTIIDDNPILTSRFYKGKNPIRIIIDPKLRIPLKSKVLNNDSKSIIFSSSNKKIDGKKIITNDFNNNESIINNIYKEGIQSVIVEGGRKTLQFFIDNDYWDCIRVFKTNKKLTEGTARPDFNLNDCDYKMIDDDRLYEIFKH